MKTIVHPADTRGHANHGWLNSYHTFSFGSYYNADRVHFGALRVLNDDTVAPGMGFGTHPHDNMEIISIPLEGDLRHRDSMGNEAIIRQGDVQVMSAGTGIEHSEMNHNRDKEVRFLQIWIFPNKKQVTPRYDQKHFDAAELKNSLTTIVSPFGSADPGVQIHQEAWFSLGHFDAGQKFSYTLKNPGNGVYIFPIEGSVQVADHTLNRRDGFGVSDFVELPVETLSDTQLLIMEVPL